MPIRRLEGKVSVVTGAGQGIGKSIALRLAAEGSDVVVADLNPVTAKEVAEEIDRMGPRAIAVTVDISKVAQIRTMVEESVKRFQKIDVLVNDAGVIQYKPLLEISERDWDSVLDVNMRGTFFCIKEVAHEMANKGGGSIVNIASVAAKYGSTGLVHYSASKMGVIGLTRAAARELAPLGIRVNAVCPGTIVTPMHYRLRKEKAEQLASQGVKPEDVKSEFQVVPLGRDGAPEDVANVVAFLASEDSSYVTGQSLNVDGGEVMD